MYDECVKILQIGNCEYIKEIGTTADRYQKQKECVMLHNLHRLHKAGKKENNNGCKN